MTGLLGAMVETAGVEAARAALARERAESLPAPGIGAFIEKDGERVLVGPSLHLSLPLWQQNAGGRGGARGELEAAEAAALAVRVRARVEQEAAADRLVLLGAAGSSLPPEGSTAADSALLAIEAGVVGGEISPTEAVLLRARIFEGERGSYAARLAEVEARIDAALATEDRGLLAP